MDEILKKYNFINYHFNNYHNYNELTYNGYIITMFIYNDCITLSVRSTYDSSLNEVILINEDDYKTDFLYYIEKTIKYLIEKYMKNYLRKIKYKKIYDN